MTRSIVAALACSILVLPLVARAAGDPDAGKAKSAVCAACHGVDGNSTNPQWPKLAGQHAKYLAKQIRDMKAGKTRSNPMMAGIIANLSEQDVEDLAAYFSQQPETGGYASKAAAAAGERLYRGGHASVGVPACTACHGPSGAGVGPAGFPRLAGQHAEYVVKQLDDFRNGARSNDPNGMMRDVVKYLTPPEIEAVAQYVQGLH